MVKSHQVRLLVYETLCRHFILFDHLNLQLLFVNVYLHWLQEVLQHSSHRGEFEVKSNFKSIRHDLGYRMLRSE